MLTKKLTLFIIISFVALGCFDKEQKDFQPKEVLEAYITKSFSIKTPEDKKDLIVFLGGEAKERLTLWSDEQFEEAFIDSKRKFKKLLFKETKKVSEEEVNIIYELSYSDNKDDGSVNVTYKKLCRLMLEDGAWKIFQVKNIKELIEYENEMSLP